MVMNWIILIVGMGLLVFLGFKANKIASSEDEAGFLLGGRSFGPVVAAGTLMATGFSGWGFVGSPGAAYAFGPTELLANFFFAPAILIAILFFSNFMRRRALKLGSLTLPEYIAQQHAANEGWSRVLQGLAGLITVVMMLTFIIGQVKALGSVASEWLHLPFNIGAFLMIVIIIAYTTAGGLAAVAWTDVVMVVGMAFAALVIMFQIFSDTSMGDMIAKLGAIDPELVNPKGAQPYGGFKLAAFLTLPWAFLWAAVVPYMGIRFLGMKETTKERDTALISLPLGLVLSLVPIVGMYVRAKGIELPEPDHAMATYLKTYMPALLAGLISLFILFAMGSTADSILHTMASATGHDLRKAVFGDKQFSGKTKLLINRSTVIVMGLLGFILYILSPPFFINFMAYLGAGTLQATLIGPIFVSTFWKGNSPGALASMIGGFLTCTILLFTTKLGWVVSPLVADAVAVFLYFAVSLATFKYIPRLQDQ
jgi:sodium/pantothenate symporter